MIIYGDMRSGLSGYKTHATGCRVIDSSATNVKASTALHQMRELTTENSAFLQKVCKLKLKKKKN